MDNNKYLEHFENFLVSKNKSCNFVVSYALKSQPMRFCIRYNNWLCTEKFMYPVWSSQEKIKPAFILESTVFMHRDRVFNLHKNESKSTTIGPVRYLKQQ